MNLVGPPDRSKISWTDRNSDRNSDRPCPILGFGARRSSDRSSDRLSDRRRDRRSLRSGPKLAKGPIVGAIAILPVCDYLL